MYAQQDVVSYSAKSFYPIAGVNEQGFLKYTDQELPAESPPQFGLHPNAEIGYLTNSCESLFKAILNIAGQRRAGLVIIISPLLLPHAPTMCLDCSTTFGVCTKI